MHELIRWVKALVKGNNKGMLTAIAFLMRKVIFHSFFTMYSVTDELFRKIFNAYLFFLVATYNFSLGEYWFPCLLIRFIVLG